MAEIRVRPVRPHGPDQSARLRADLATAYERGTDLGPRSAHIRACGDRLLGLSRALEHANADLNLSLIELGLLSRDRRQAPRGFVIEAESLANTAQSFANTARGLVDTAQRFPAAL